jgi:uncharacterized membrane protein YdjX (TVP38/TMEM64 family)
VNRRARVRDAGRIAGVVFWIVITALPIMGVVLSIVDPVKFYSSQEQFRAFAQRYGQWTPVAFVILQSLQVVVTPISHYSVGYMGGFLFGPLVGCIYNYIGRMIGHVTAFWISRIFGSALARRFVPADVVAKYDRHVSGRADILFLIYFLPLFPDDEISYLAGLSRMPFRWFFLANVFGQVGGSASLAYLGSGVDTKDPVFWILTVSTLLGFPALWWLARRRPIGVSDRATRDAIGSNE